MLLSCLNQVCPMYSKSPIRFFNVSSFSYTSCYNLRVFSWIVRILPWNRYFRLFLGGKGKPVWLQLNNNLQRRILNVLHIEKCTIFCWFFNSTDMFMHHDTALCLWVALRQMYAHSRNDVHIFELYQEISHASQEALQLLVAELSGIYFLAGTIGPIRALEWLSGWCSRYYGQTAHSLACISVFDGFETRVRVSANLDFIHLPYAVLW